MEAVRPLLPYVASLEAYLLTAEARLVGRWASKKDWVDCGCVHHLTRSCHQPHPLWGGAQRAGTAC